MVVRNTSKRLHTSICVGDKLHIHSKQVSHTLDISCGYARHYLDVCVICLNVCQRSHNLCPAYAERLSHTLSNVENCMHAQNVSTTSPYYDLYQRSRACSLLIRCMPAYLPKSSYVDIRWLNLLTVLIENINLIHTRLLSANTYVGHIFMMLNMFGCTYIVYNIMPTFSIYEYRFYIIICIASTSIKVSILDPITGV